MNPHEIPPSGLGSEPDCDGRDTLYAGGPAMPAGPFRFDESVSRVFPDMISRSVPGYAQILEMTGMMARSQVRDGDVCHDLGCSLGAATLAMRRNIQAAGCTIVAVDESAAMLDRCRENLAQDNSRVDVEFVEADIRTLELRSSAMVVCNFTLQFLPPRDRLDLLARICDSLRPGGVLILAEKISFADPAEQTTMTNWHHDFKRLRGYSDLEIARKRQALENVLVPDTAPVHLARLQSAGFQRACQWFQWFNFAAFCAWKGSGE